MQGTCLCCNRPLSVAESVIRGLGPICAAKKAAELAGAPDRDAVDLPFDPETKDILCRRDADGKLHFNIYQIVHHHSPTGFEWGYGGSGPADFALNILELFMREKGFKPDLPIRDFQDGEITTLKICSRSWKLHQEFKWLFVASLPREGGTIEGDAIRAFINRKLKEDGIFELAWAGQTTYKGDYSDGNG